MLRENNECFVMKADCFVNLGACLITNLEVFGSEPAADAFVLQVGIEAVGEGLVFARVANKARVELKGLHRVDDVRDVFNYGVGYAGLTEKNLGDLALGFDDRSYTNFGRMKMFNSFKAQRLRKINRCKLCKTYSAGMKLCFIKNYTIKAC